MNIFGEFGARQLRFVSRKRRGPDGTAGLSYMLIDNAGGRFTVDATAGNASYYLAMNPDVANAGDTRRMRGRINASGWHEGRDPNALFSTSWYRSTYGDVAAAGVNPLTHYMQDGWSQQRDPSPWFDFSHYVAANPNVAAAGANLLMHFYIGGLNEGRLAYLV